MSSAGPRLLVAVTGHGYGHATRVAEVVRGILELAPGLRVTLATTVPARVFELGELSGRVDFLRVAYEPGVVQRTCLDVDWDATRAAYGELLGSRERGLEAERQRLRAGGYRGVLADIPALPIAAAASLGVPAAALWSFTWDWILEPELAPGLPGVDRELAALPAMLRADYARAGLHLKLPFSPPTTSLPRVEEAPLIGRRSTRNRAETRALIGLERQDSRPVALVAMGGWECGDWEPIAVEGSAAIRLVVVGDIPLRAAGPILRLPATLGEGLRFCDLVAAADLVIAKPGYGICSECVVNRTPLLGVERRGFREVAELLRDMPAHGPFAELSREDFFAGRWEPAVSRLLAAPAVWQPVDPDAARHIARRLARFFAF
jgi:hypothetical protein